MKWFGLLFLIISGFQSSGQTRPDVVLTTGHNDQINAMDVTPNGRFLASASNDKQIKIWDLATGFEFRTISGSDGRVEQIAFSADNKTLAGTSFNNELLIWDVISGDLVYSGGAGSGRGLKFSKDGRSVFYISEDSKIAVYNLDTKSNKVLSDKYTMEFIADVEREVIYLLDHLGNLHKINSNSGAEIQVFKLFDEFNYPFSNSDITPDGKYIGFGFNDDKFRLFNTETGKFDFVSKAYQSKIICLAFDRKKPIVYISTHQEQVVLFNYKTNKVVSHFSLPDRMFAIQTLKAHPNGELVLFASYDQITLYDFNHQKVFKSLSRKVNRIFNMTYDPTGKYMAVATDKLNLQIWDLGLNKVVDSIQAFFPCQFTPNGKYILAMTNTMKLGLFDVETGKRVKSYDTGYELIQCLAISKDGTKIAGAGYQNKVKIWDVATAEQIAELEGHTGGILGLDFHPTKPWIVSGSLDQTSRVWNYETKSEIKQFTDQTISIHDVKFSPDGAQLATAAWDKTIFLRATADWSTQFKLLRHINIVNSIDYSANSEVLLSGAGNNSVGDADNSIICWNAKSGTQKCQFSDHNGEILKVIADPLANRFFSASIDGAIKYSDYETCELIATYQAIGSKEFMIYTPDNYYIASRNALNGIAFRIGDKIVPFEQFDIHLNRPDIVADRIGKSHPQLIKAYYYLYKKRLKKLNLEEGSIQMDYKLPNLVNESKYELVNTTGTQKFWIKAWDDNYNISSISVYVNNVPIFGAAGLTIEGNVKSIRKEIEVPLIQGKNRILISCRNSNGVESLYEQMEIYGDGGAEKHNLYIVAIGVSNYKDDRFNLKYPTKDATDILAKFSESENRYEQIYSRLLLDEDVILENIIGLKEFFKNCTHEDLAIIFIAGHGVLNVDYDYFFGTYDMDFDAPEGRGLPYSSVSTLLNQIRAYEKILIMDTCHSGELDKDEIEKGPDPEVEDGDIQFRSAGAGIRKKEGLGFENMLKMTEDLFSDIRKGSGATVISSSGGAEYAMESDLWNNGLFTHVLLEGLSQTQKDSIYLSEIRHYVNAEVNRISNGRQIPSSREENISRDYIIFGK